MFKKNSGEQVESLDQPLLDRSNADGDDDDRTYGRTTEPPIATNVGILGIGPERGKGYARVVDGDDSEQAEQEARARAERLNAFAMEKQKNNQAAFEGDMKALEERVIREAKEKARLEENDRLLALRLQQEEGGQQGMAAAPMPATTTMLVTVPPEARGGQMIAVQVPGHGMINIMVPRGLKGGDQFNFRIPTAAPPVHPSATQRQVQQTVVRVPRGVSPGGSFRVILPTNRVLVVGVPAGVKEGDSIRVQYDETSGTPNTDPRLQPRYADDQQDESIAIMESIQEVRETEAERAEREAFLSALPEDVRREVLAQETAQKRRLSAYGKSPETLAAPPPPPIAAPPSPTDIPLTAEQKEFLRTLPEELRGEVERDLRAQNARNPPQTSTPSRPPPAQGAPRASPAPVSQEADLLGLSSMSYPPSAPPAALGATPSPATATQSTMDMFQNLSVRGVSKDSKSTRGQEI